MAETEINQLTVEATEITEGSFIMSDINIGTVGTPIYETQKVPEYVLFSDVQKPKENTYSEIAALISSSGLEKGTSYSLVDKDITVTASSENSLCIGSCRKMRIVKETYYTVSGINLSVWHSGLTPSVSDITVWGGKCWFNVSGAVGSKIDDENLSSDWTVIATTNGTYYEDRYFFIMYDFANDWIGRQYDEKGNVFGTSYNVAYTFNPVDICDWGNTRITDNNCIGVYNCAVSGAISRNYASGAIQDVVSTEIYGNYCTLPSGISFVKASGIQFNNCQYISNCDIVGEISRNRIGKQIEGIMSPTTDVIDNINNGSIQTSTLGVISDTVVNK